ncbi:RagB/SusD family nutrient uptake outer membrane protein [Niabella sp. W65]|nr:RagB/SusD family nutrient uptake outer membrane protein [Niabella sp. W65]MCH7363219.1 RagB/SusD family nutrient uptake outer membrane protein [Niabella sp. W65]ULT39146.1 RagB/SusD family nutrient uptake outer membrane protein [Niabella sp. I65]
MIRKYGPVPLVPEHGLDYTESYSDLSLPRNTHDECVDFITSELALAAKDLPASLRDSRNLVRPTRGAALAARAKVYLYAASPLYNGNADMADLVDDKGRQLIAQQYNEEKWARAAAAAKEVIDMGIYKLYTYPYHAESQGPDYPPTIVPRSTRNIPMPIIPMAGKISTPWNHTGLCLMAMCPSWVTRKLYSRG